MFATMPDNHVREFCFNLKFFHAWLYRMQNSVKCNTGDINCFFEQIYFDRMLHHSHLLKYRQGGMKCMGWKCFLECQCFSFIQRLHRGLKFISVWCVYIDGPGGLGYL